MYMVLWNVRGMGKIEKRRAIRDVLNESYCDVVFIQESKIVGPSAAFYQSLGAFLWVGTLEFYNIGE